MSSDPASIYRIELLHSARARIKQCGDRTVRLGIAKEYAATLRSILENLTISPLTWGDPIRRYHEARLLLCRRVFDRILTEYAVHEESNIVYVKDCTPVLGHPLESSI
jgi:hypothetical protein